MKKVFAITAAFTLALSLVGCGSGSSAQPSVSSQYTEEAMQVSSGSVIIEVPADWEIKEAADGKYIYPEFGGMVYLKTDAEMDSKSTSVEEFYASYMNGLTNSGSVTATSEPVRLSIGNSAAMRTQVNYNTNDELMYGWNELIISGFNVYNVLFIVPESVYESKTDLMLDALDSITVTDSEIPMFHASSNQDSQDSAIEQEQVSLSMTNAVKKAKEYLNFSAFSYSGLVEQLEFEGFPHDDAIYGADNCGADWNEQAAKKAADYLEYSSFSHSGLVEQLVFEGFTEEQAEYGASAVGL